MILLLRIYYLLMILYGSVVRLMTIVLSIPKLGLYAWKPIRFLTSFFPWTVSCKPIIRMNQSQQEIWNHLRRTKKTHTPRQHFLYQYYRFSLDARDQGAIVHARLPLSRYLQRAYNKGQWLVDTMLADDLML